MPGRRIVMLVAAALLALGLGPATDVAPAGAAGCADALCTRLRAELTSFTQWLNANSADGFIGEVGWPGGSSVPSGDRQRWNALAEQWYRDADAAGLWVSYWATGEWWGTSYKLSVYDIGSKSTLSRARSPSAVVEAHPTSGSRLRGVSDAGGEFGYTPNIQATSTFSNETPGVYNRDWHYDTKASFRYLAGRGVRLVRIPFRWERLQPAINGPLSIAELLRLRGAVDRATAAGLQVVLDMHNYGAYYRFDGTRGVRLGVGSAALPDTAFADVWRRIAVAFADRPGVVGWGLMNEPVGLAGSGGLSPAQVWERASQAAVDAIRATGDRRTVLVGGYEWSGAQVFADVHDDAWITDPAANVRYEAHHYWDADHSGTYPRSYAQEVALSG